MLSVKSYLNDKEHFYCRPNDGETVRQYGTQRSGIGEGGVFVAVSAHILNYIKERKFDENVKLINERSDHNQ